MYNEHLTILLFLGLPYIVSALSWARVGLFVAVELLFMRVYFGCFVLLSSFACSRATGCFLGLLTIFHWVELEAARKRVGLISVSDYFTASLLTTSFAYSTAVFGLTVWCPSDRELSSDSYGCILALAICVSGIALRAVALRVSGTNFAHMIPDRMNVSHVLITDQFPYSVMRHPAYTGWFYFVVGSQVLMRTGALGCLAIAVSAWFLKSRISYEETVLTQSHPEYLAYKSRVRWTGLVFPLT